MLFGTCYYPEQWPRERWEVDAQLMQSAGIEMIRVGEFAWSALEPTPGVMAWEWLDEAIALFGRYNIKTMIGTPTATPPIWLTRRHPDILRVDHNLLPREHGGRKHYCPNSPTYRALSHEIVTKLVERYADNRNIIGWQIDNEFGENGSAYCHCQTCKARFQEWLHKKYGTIDALNAAWGNPFWSQMYGDWGDIPLPNIRNPRPNPCQQLDFYRFSTDSFVSYQQEQIDLIRTTNREHLITHNYMGLFPDLDGFKLAEPYDFASWDNYPTGFSERFSQLVGTDKAYAYDVGDPIIIGLSHALMYGLKQRPHWVMEQQCGYINWGVFNPVVRPNTPRLWVYHAISEGAESIVFFRWRATLMAHEQYHSGLIKHDGSPDVGYDDLIQLQREREQVEAIRDEEYAADIAILYDYEDLWAQQLQPHREGWHYIKLIHRWYATIRQMGLNVHVVPKTADLTPYKTVISPSAHIVDGAFSQTLTDYANQGGTLILGVRSGFKTPSNLVTEKPLPGELRDLVGADVTSWGALPPDVGIPLVAEEVQVTGGDATVWRETLKPTTATSIVSYADDHAALTVNHVGAGRATYVGWLPTKPQIRAILIYHGMLPLVVLPAGMMAQQRGDQLILLNFTDQVQTAFIDGGERSIDIPPRNIQTISDYDHP